MPFYFLVLLHCFRLFIPFFLSLLSLCYFKQCFILLTCDQEKSPWIMGKQWGRQYSCTSVFIISFLSKQPWNNSKPLHLFVLPLVNMIPFHIFSVVFFCHSLHYGLYPTSHFSRCFLSISPTLLWLYLHPVSLSLTLTPHSVLFFFLRWDWDAGAPLAVRDLP